jgi:hypothetical protein
MKDIYVTEEVLRRYQNHKFKCQRKHLKICLSMNIDPMKINETMIVNKI